MLLPPAVKQGAEAFGLDPCQLVALGGNSGSSWGIGDQVLRVGPRIDAEIQALRAAAGLLPVPRVLGRTDLRAGGAALLERLPGRPAGEIALSHPRLASAIGRACGAIHALLSQIPAPAGVRVLSTGDRPSRRCLLHLDLHPFNVLVDDSGEVSGVIDWANAAVGDPALDRARTWSILLLDPAARAREVAAWAKLTSAWITEAGLTNLPCRARAWACEFMLDDLAERHSREALKPVAAVLDALRCCDS